MPLYRELLFLNGTKFSKRGEKILNEDEPRSRSLISSENEQNVELMAKLLSSITMIAEQKGMDVIYRILTGCMKNLCKTSAQTLVCRAKNDPVGNLLRNSKLSQIS